MTDHNIPSTEGNTPFTSDEVNFLIYRYMLENGFQHSAFSFFNESNLSSCSIEGTMVPRGALISIIQKGLYFTEAEFFSTLAASASDRYEAMKYESALGSIGLLDAVLPDGERFKRLEQRVVDELGEEACSKLPLNVKIQDTFRPDSAISAPSTQGSSDTEMAEEEEDRKADEKEQTVGNGHDTFNAHGQSPGRSQANSYPVAGHSGKKQAAAAAAYNKPGQNSGQLPSFANMTALTAYPNGKLLPSVPNAFDPELELDRNKIRTLHGHEADVFICSWNPKRECFASGSGDSTARLWFPGVDFKADVGTSVLLHEIQRPTKEQKNKDVTSLNWNANGEYLATGCYDGVARIWDTRGALIAHMNAHTGPIFALKWNYAGTKVLSAGVDNTTVVWDPSGKQPGLKVFKFHTQSALDVDWINDEMFASCSVDSLIHVCQCTREVPIKTFKGHENEVNAVRYDRVSGLLASCSDDRTLKVWSLDKDKPVFDVAAHDKEIYTIRWSPLGHILASASFDHSVKIWDLQRNNCARQLQKHTESVYTVAFHPEGRILASGSFDKTINIWDLRTGEVVMTYTGCELTGGFFEVDWNRTGEKLAASAAAGTLLLFDLRGIREQLR